MTNISQTPEIQQLQQYILNMLAPVKGADGLPINVASIMNEYLQAFGDPETVSQFGILSASNKQQYEFFGEEALRFSTATYVRNRFMSLETDILKKMTDLMMKRHVLIKRMCKKLEMSQYILGDNPRRTEVETMLAILGITQAYFGCTAVNAFMAPLFDEFCYELFLPLPKVLRTSIGLEPSAISTLGPSYAFQNFIKTTDGRIEFSYHSTTDNPAAYENAWSCTVRYSLTSNSQWYSHTRAAKNKKKARTAISADIMQFYEKQPHLRNEHKTPTNEPSTTIPLPIDPSDYYQVPSTTAVSNPNPAKNMDELMRSASSSHVFIPEKRREYDMEMSSAEENELINALLGNFARMHTDDDESDSSSSAKRIKTGEEAYDTPQSLQSEEPNKSRESDMCSLPSPITPVPEDDLVEANPGGKDRIRKLFRGVANVKLVATDPQQRRMPKSALLALLQKTNGIKFITIFNESGPAHCRIFQATSTLIAGDDYLQVKRASRKKTDSESQATLAILDILAADS
ncbi:uncharacterized protein BYT42DRAFT_607789 [Radiomyces spectabilis]|uniref:uncharacterized protein n=1 Tax=Radiomyces spectabilis TaxID=64574 RepID=UPI00221F76A3|nr:uncharacterized protein BYT42DRAFT_607789 [Radiomyces spectabilis]KAI8369356.1 hypothetical protein BYT42DRAFT_607789 [Radiomyces spectabilis]